MLDEEESKHTHFHLAKQNGFDPTKFCKGMLRLSKGKAKPV
jgi:hypothetical protein